MTIFQHYLKIQKGRQIVSNLKLVVRNKVDSPALTKQPGKNSKPPSLIIPSLTLSGFIIGSTAYFAYKSETSSEFASSVESYSPFFAQYLKPYRNYLRSSGLVKHEANKMKNFSGLTEEKAVQEDIHENSKSDIVLESNPPSPESEINIIENVTEDIKEDIKPNVTEIATEKILEEGSDIVVETQATESVELIRNNSEVIESKTEKSPEKITDVVTQTPVSKATLPTYEIPRVFWNEADLTFLKDLNSLSEKELRQRVELLANELIERTKWEGIRLHETLKEAEKDIAKHYSELLVKQRQELQLEMERTLAQEHLHEQEVLKQSLSVEKENLEQRLHDTIRSQAEGFNAALKNELRSQAEKLTAEAELEKNVQIAQIKEQHVRETLPLIEKAEKTRGMLTAYLRSVEDINSRAVISTQLHLSSAATMALENALKESGPIQDEVKALQSSWKDDEVVSLVLASLPSVTCQKGIPSVAEIRANFAVVRDVARKAALVPEAAPSLIGNVLGNLFASLVWVPKGYVAGEGLEETLSRAAFLVDFGDLEGALKEIQTLQGRPRSATKEWEKIVQDRLEVEQALKVLKAISSLRHLEFVN